MTAHYKPKLPMIARCILLLLATPAATAAAVAADASSPGVSAQIIAPDNPEIHYIGRFDTTTAHAPRCAWPASAVRLRFTGTHLSASIDDSSASDAFEIVVDHRPPTVLTLRQGAFDYPLFDQSGSRSYSRGPHTVTLTKRTESFVGTAQFLSFTLAPGGKLLPVPKPKHRLEIVGDSISCGYGDEGANEHEHFLPEHENAYASYGAVAARYFGADFTDIAWSGRKMSPDNTMPSIFDLAVPTDPGSHYDVARDAPDTILINLATNDFARGDPDRAAWTAAYEAFVERLRAFYPRAAIYLASGPSMTDAYPPGNMALTTLNSYLTQIQQDEQKRGDSNIRLIFFTPQNAAVDGLGADYHPNLKTHAHMAAQLEQALTNDLAWNPQP